jgi:subfamily B ATP-binding cassette protein MsbA
MGSFWRLLHYLLSYRLLIALSVLANMMTAAFTVVSIPAIIPFLEVLFEKKPRIQEVPAPGFSADELLAYLQFHLWQVVDEQGKDIALFYVCLVIVVLFFLKNVFRYLAAWFMAPVRHGVIRDLRQRIFQRTLMLPISYFTEQRKGDLIARASSDVVEVEHSIVNMLQAIFREPLILFGCLGYMIFVSPQLLLIVLGLLAFTVVIIGGIGKQLRRTSRQVQERLADIVSTLEESIGGIRIIKAFTAEAYQQSRFDKDNDTYNSLIIKLARRRDLASPLSEFLGVSVVVALLWFGSRLVFTQDLSPSTFFSFLLAFFFMLDPAKKFSSAWYNVQKGVAALDRIEQVLHQPSEINASPQPARMEAAAFHKDITFRDVSFKYPNSEEWVLRHIDLHIRKGRTVALVGRSGAGKSTLADLLPGFYHPTVGQICIDGTDIMDIPLPALRKLMGVVSQEAILFNDTIYQNIVFGAEGVTTEQVEQAARIANAHEFILATEQGYNTVIGDRGAKLSGGQRQRLTIARAVLNNPPILILDEATSALDSEAEKLVQDALIKVMKGRTAIVIAHRLSTIQHADEIIVLEHGHIVERGTHDSLLEHPKGAYRKLVNLQAF